MRSSKEVARQALVMVLEMSRKFLGNPLRSLNHDQSHSHAQLNRVSVMTSLREIKVMMQTWAILRVTGDPESRLERKEKQRESGSMSSIRDLFSFHDSQGGPKLSDISKRRESIVCSVDGGERRIVDRWGDKGMSQDLLQEWTGSTRFRMS